ncbi:TIGR03016 family PEP-CTERM system-associated outer membrane protein [Colwellia sp. 1_MG-2023]|uniref:TIGR03016 family PEP-CTERM system-associated outer membrane protein n=1 Tax=Colwellia sp. 1_MG-2023 TaxID=3062649 RepID=UPI0026E1A87D|nr:TIGR03016 family PEP-CTERM system-associated outer membrane protein [Colwellia sp. 1_MG-2023]MDO6444961.1 TIGR03016 family PEP-CTERM system-associated outer membrane protein [Colwellia sp. 1_MG-2023]
MAIMAMDTAKKTKIATFCIASVFSHVVSAGEWQFNPSLLLDETFSDNIELTDTDKVSSLVSQTGINLSTSYESQLLTFDFHSNSVYATYSHDHDLDDDYHTLGSNFALKMGEQGLALVGSAKVENQVQNEAQNSLANIIFSDTIRKESYSSGFTYNVNNSDFLINSSLMYSLIEVEDGIGNQKGFYSSVLMKNGRQAKIVFWDIDGNYYDLKNGDSTSRLYRGEVKLGLITDWKINPFLRYYDEDNKGSLNRGQSTESNSYGIGVRWNISPRLQFDISYNNPIGNTLDLDGKEQEKYIAANIDWQPTTRTTVKANLSQRFYGDSYGLSLSHANKRLSNSISYQETVESFSRNNYNVIPLGSFFCPRGDTIDLNNCFSSDNTEINFDNFDLINLVDYELVEGSSYTLNKSLSWSTVLTLPRTTFNFSVTSLNIENLDTNIADQRDTLGFDITRKVSGRSNLNLNVTYNYNQFSIETETYRQDRYRAISIGYQKSLSSKLHLNFGLAHLNRSSQAREFNYEEGRVTFKITKDF